MKLGRLLFLWGLGALSLLWSSVACATVLAVDNPLLSLTGTPGALLRDSDVLYRGWITLIDTGNVYLDESRFAESGQGIEPSTVQDDFLTVPIFREVNAVTDDYLMYEEGTTVTNTISMSVVFHLSESLPPLSSITNSQVGARVALAFLKDDEQLYVSHCEYGEDDYSGFQPPRFYPTGYFITDFPTTNTLKIVSFYDNRGFAAYQVFVNNKVVTDHVGYAFDIERGEFDRHTVGPWVYSIMDWGLMDPSNMELFRGVSFSASGGWIDQLKLIYNDPKFEPDPVVVPDLPPDFLAAGVTVDDPDYVAWCERNNFDAATELVNADLTSFLFNTATNVVPELRISSIVVDGATVAVTIVTDTASASAVNFMDLNATICLKTCPHLGDPWQGPYYYPVDGATYKTLLEQGSATVILKYDAVTKGGFIKASLIFRGYTPIDGATGEPQLPPTT